MAKAKGLGKGLASLIPTEGNYDKDVKLPEPVVKEVIKEVIADKYLKIYEVEPNRNQPRKVFEEEALEELANSIRRYGVIQPVVVIERIGYYEIVAGERRWRAAKLAGLQEIPVIVKNYSDLEAAEIALIENLQREDLSPIEEAKAYQQLMEEYSLRQEDIAQRVGKNRATIANSLRLLRLSEKVQMMLNNATISSGHAKVLLALTDLHLQDQAAMKIEEKQLSVRETEKLVKSMLKPTIKKEKVELENEETYHQIQEKLRAKVNSKVNIVRKNNEKGKIEIEYYSEEDLERIIDILGIF